MTRIVYGVSGEGSGHSSRAREMLTHLVGAGHDVKVASYDRGYRNLKDDFDVLEIEGLSIRTDDNRVQVVETFVHNLKKLPEGFRKARELDRLFDDFEPEVVITDFEPTTAYLANTRGLPLVTIDNQHRMRYMRYPLPDRLRKDALVTEAVIRLVVPRPDVSLVTTFYRGDVKNERTFLFPPILRREVLDLEPRAGEHVLVYFTQDFGSFLEVLRELERERFLVYGYDRDAVEGNLTFRPFSNTGFLDDLASCKAVVSTAGFTLMTESLHLAKPMLALPMRGQFEQELNALLLEEAGWGRNGRRAERADVEAFLYRVPDYRERLASPEVAAQVSDGNRAITAKLDELVADGGAAAVAAHRDRE